MGTSICGGGGGRSVVGADVGCATDVRHSLYGQPLPVSAGDATPKRLLLQEYGDCTGLETEVSVFSTKVAEP